MVFDVCVFSINAIFDTILIRADVTTSTSLATEDLKRREKKKQSPRSKSTLLTNMRQTSGNIIDALVSFLFIDERERKFIEEMVFYWSNSNLASVR